MKHFLLSGSAIVAMASAAQAEVEFVKGTASVDYSTYADAPFGIMNVDTDVAFNVGNYGFQIGADNNTLVGDAPNFSFSSFELHYYRNLANGNKIGIFTESGSAFFGPFGSTSVGVEGMFSFGNVDLEASFGYIGSDFFDDIGEVNVNGYVGLSDDLEMSAGIIYVFAIDGEGYELGYRIGGSYDIGDSGLSINASYTGFEDGFGDGLYSVGVTWEFGPNQDERLFDRLSFGDLFGGGFA